MRAFVTFVFFCSSLICNGLDRPRDADSRRQLNVRLIFEQKGTKEPSREGAPGGLDGASGFPFPL